MQPFPYSVTELTTVHAYATLGANQEARGADCDKVVLETDLEVSSTKIHNSVVLQCGDGAGVNVTRNHPVAWQVLDMLNVAWQAPDALNMMAGHGGRK